ncbi:MAG TPA: hypothetical protein VHY34_03475 [Caulobacteraceae bacterium]|jgi:hypothetical protein|nr:hypothetical protein [Caulobacteraceae bacterium]
MNRIPNLRICALSGVLALSASTLAQSASSTGTIRFHGGAVAFIAGVNWGGGALHYRGRDYPLQVTGLSVGAIGAKSFDARGTVSNLHKVSDIEGTYAAVHASATVGGGAGLLEMQNGAGVGIKVQSTSLGAHLSLGPSGVQIKLKQ